MSTSLHPSEFLALLRCPCSPAGDLVMDADAARCTQCGLRYPITAAGILELVNIDRLDAETARELRGNTFTWAAGQIEQATQTERQAMWRNYYTRSRKASMAQTARVLQTLPGKEMFFLGCGRGRDIEYLLSFMPLHTVYASDLSLTALQVTPQRLQPYPLRVGLFTSDLNACPIAVQHIPVVVVNALHHTEDMHATLEAMLGNGYRTIVLNEPANNWLIRGLARRGVAQRVEYSGVKPGRLELRTVSALAERYGYHMHATTSWVFPGDYYRRLLGRVPALQSLFLAALGLLSRLTNPVKFGNQVVMRLEKIS